MELSLHALVRPLRFVLKLLNIESESTFSAYYIWVLLATVLFIYMVHLYYKLPNRVRDLSDIGFWHLKDQDRRRGLQLKELANESLKRQGYGEVPPVYPNGWFSVAESRDLKTGDVRPLTVLGQNLVLFRGEDGTSHILDAYCPHLGAHLGAGGKVIGGCIECPFHGWRFRGSDGRCTGIPYAEKVPEFSKVKAWATRELNGHIYLWFHAEGKEPYWEPEEVPEITRKQFVYRGRSEHYVRAHIQEIPENGADVAHLAQVHQANLLAGSDIRKMNGNVIWDIGTHVWEASWQPGEAPKAHIANLKVEHSLKLFRKFNLISLKVNVRQIGPALVHLEFNTPFGRAVLFHHVTPVEPLLQKLTHALFCDPSMPHLYSRLILYGEAVMVERDIAIWNHKVFMHKPLLVKEDKFIAKMRRWYSQFYSENSPKLQFRKDTLDW